MKPRSPRPATSGDTSSPLGVSPPLGEIVRCHGSAAARILADGALSGTWSCLRGASRVFAHSRGDGTSPVRPDPGSGNAALAPRAKGPHAQDTTHFLCMFSCALERNAVLTFLGVVACATRTSTIVRRPGRRITPTSHDMGCMGRKSEDLKRTGRGMAPVWASRQQRACGCSSCGGAWLGAQRQAVGQWPSEAARRPR